MVELYADADIQEVSVGSTGWQTVDVSAYVTSGTVGVIVQAHNASSSAITWGYQRYGATADRTGTLQANSHNVFTVGVDGSYRFEVYTSDATNLDLYLIGEYTSGDAYFFTNAESGYDVTPSTSGSFQDIDCTSYLQGGDDMCGVLLQIVSTQTSKTYKCNLSKNGGTQLTNSAIAGIEPATCGVDANDIFEANLYSTTDTKIWLLGYLKGSPSSGVAYFPDTMTEYNPTGTTLWEDIVTISSGYHGSIWYMEQNSTITSKTYGFRSDDSTRTPLWTAQCDFNYFYQSRSHATTRIVEGRTSSTADNSFYLQGYYKAETNATAYPPVRDCTAAKGTPTVIKSATITMPVRDCAAAKGTVTVTKTATVTMPIRDCTASKESITIAKTASVTMPVRDCIVRIFPTDAYEVGCDNKWDFNQSGGGNVDDSIGSLDLTNHNATAQVTGYNNCYCYDFNGTSAYLEAATNLALSNKWSIEFIASATHDSSWRGPMGDFTPGASKNGWTFLRHPTANQYYFEVDDTGTPMWGIYSAKTDYVSDTVYHHVFTFDGDANITKYYCSGGIDKTDLDQPGVMVNDSSTLKIGEWTATGYWKGDIYLIRIYDGVVLDQDAITHNYNAEKWRYSPSVTVTKTATVSMPVRDCTADHVDPTLQILDVDGAIVTNCQIEYIDSSFLHGTTIDNVGQLEGQCDAATNEDDHIVVPSGVYAWNFEDYFDYIYIASSSPITNPQKITIEAIIRIDSQGASQYGIIYFKGASVSKGLQFRYDLTNDLIELTRYTTTGQQKWTGTFDVSFGNWYFLQASWDMTSTSNTPIIHINDSDISLTHALDQGTTWSDDTGQDLVVGTNYAQSQNIVGPLVVYRQHSTNLSSSDLTVNYNASKWRFSNATISMSHPDCTASKVAPTVKISRTISVPVRDCTATKGTINVTKTASVTMPVRDASVAKGTVTPTKISNPTVSMTIRDCTATKGTVTPTIIQDRLVSMPLRDCIAVKGMVIPLVVQDRLVSMPLRDASAAKGTATPSILQDRLVSMPLRDCSAAKGIVTPIKISNPTVSMPVRNCNATKVSPTVTKTASVTMPLRDCTASKGTVTPSIIQDRLVSMPLRDCSAVKGTVTPSIIQNRLVSMPLRDSTAAKGTVTPLVVQNRLVSMPLRDCTAAKGTVTPIKISNPTVSMTVRDCTVAKGTVTPSIIQDRLVSMPLRDCAATKGTVTPIKISNPTVSMTVRDCTATKGTVTPSIIQTRTVVMPVRDCIATKEIVTISKTATVTMSLRDSVAAKGTVTPSILQDRMVSMPYRDCTATKGAPTPILISNPTISVPLRDCTATYGTVIPLKDQDRVVTMPVRDCEAAKGSVTISKTATIAVPVRDCSVDKVSPTIIIDRTVVVPVRDCTAAKGTTTIAKTALVSVPYRDCTAAKGTVTPVIISNPTVAMPVRDCEAFKGTVTVESEQERTVIMPIRDCTAEKGTVTPSVLQERTVVMPIRDCTAAKGVVTPLVVQDRLVSMPVRDCAATKGTVTPSVISNPTVSMPYRDCTAAKGTVTPTIISNPIVVMSLRDCTATKGTPTPVLISNPTVVVPLRDCTADYGTVIPSTGQNRTVVMPIRDCTADKGTLTPLVVQERTVVMPLRDCAAVRGAPTPSVVQERTVPMSYRDSTADKGTVTPTVVQNRTVSMPVRDCEAFKGSVTPSVVQDRSVFVTSPDAISQEIVNPMIEVLTAHGADVTNCYIEWDFNRSDSSDVPNTRYDTDEDLDVVGATSEQMASGCYNYIFDGENDYASSLTARIPSGSYTLEMLIKIDNLANQTILNNYDVNAKGYELMLRSEVVEGQTCYFFELNNAEAT